MRLLTRRAFLASSVLLAACSRGFRGSGQSKERFVCPPCGCAADGQRFDAPGRCPACDMTLVPDYEHRLGFEPRRLAAGAGEFGFAGGPGREARRITVHYYLPDSAFPPTRILLVVPGAGRDSYEYRNEWFGFARDNDALVAALGYPEEHYDFAAYHMGGVITNLEFANLRPRPSGAVYLNDEDIAFDVNPNRADWLFGDFDRLFNFLKAATGSPAERYDIFGHSAGGQILHRFVLFHPRSRADNIVAANAGFYTLPLSGEPLPSGIAGLGIADESLVDSYAAKLTLLLGENDDSDDAGGTLLRTPIIDRQGQGRLSRGRNFFRIGQERARQLQAGFRWRVETVPDVGHDFREMSRAAAALLTARSPALPRDP